MVKLNKDILFGGEQVADELSLTIIAAVDIANSITDDVQEQRHVSDETIALVAKFRNQYAALEGMLDTINGVM